MGTGMVSILLHQLPFQFRGLEYISIAIWMLNVFLFLVLTAGSLWRYLMWPHLFIDVLKHPVQSCYLYPPLSNGRLRWLLIKDCVLMVGEHFPWA